MRILFIINNIARGYCCGRGRKCAPLILPDCRSSVVITVLMVVQMNVVMVSIISGRTITVSSVSSMISITDTTMLIWLIEYKERQGEEIEWQLIITY